MRIHTATRSTPSSVNAARVAITAYAAMAEINRLFIDI